MYTTIKRLIVLISKYKLKNFSSLKKKFPSIKEKYFVGEWDLLKSVKACSG